MQAREGYIILMIQSCLDQLNKWVEGISEHNTERNECCPDFSCCGGRIASLKERIMFRDAYVNGNQDLIDDMLMMFLGSAASDLVNKEGKKIKVHIAGDAETHEV